MSEPVPPFRRPRTYTPEEYERALQMMAETILLFHGATVQGTRKYMNKLVQEYLDRATGEKGPFLDSIFYEEFAR